MKRLILTLITAITLTSCSEVRTTNPKKVYKYWSGSKAPADLELLKGQYRQSAHWTREYIMYLKLKPTEKWWSEFLEQNQLKKENHWTSPSDAPEWFTPTETSVIYGSGNDIDQGSRYFRDTLTNECYIYEIQL